MEFDFGDQVVLVTGASRGIGRAIARMFATAGARVVVHYNHNRDAAQHTLAGLAGDGHLLAQADLTAVDDDASLAADVITQVGRIHVLVNNAGVFEAHPIADVSFDGWQRAWARTLHTNLIGPAHLTFHVARHMIEHGGGRIVNVSSRGAFRGEPTAPAYGASKAGLNAMGQSLAQALAPHGVFVHTVAPGFVETERVAPRLSGSEGEAIRGQSPLGRVAQPDEVARTVLFLAAPGTEFLTGCIVDINGASYLRT
jgi:3-oxoacyl-[acyl-carrier protein] reductase